VEFRAYFPELALVTLDELAECLLVSSLDAGNEIAGHRSFLRASVCPGPG